MISWDGLRLPHYRRGFCNGVKLIIYNVCMNAHKIFNITTIFT